jgi:hypothetical protein
VFLLFHEIQTARSLPTAAVVLMGALAAAAALLLGFYAYRSLGWIMARQCDVGKLKEETLFDLQLRAELFRGREGELHARSFDLPTADELDPGKPAWSLL